MRYADDTAILTRLEDLQTLINRIVTNCKEYGLSEHKQTKYMLRAKSPQDIRLCRLYVQNHPI